jgi:hypothetical protein
LPLLPPLPFRRHFGYYAQLMFIFTLLTLFAFFAIDTLPLFRFRW